MAKNAPFVPMDPRWWPDIAAEMPRPWPAKAVYFDLRWWRDQEDRGRDDDGGKPVKRPGRYALVERWGWTHHAVSEALKAEHRWADPYKIDRQENVNPASSDRQRAVNAPSEKESQDVEITRAAVNEPSTRRQRAVNAPSSNRPTRVLSTPIHLSTDPQSTPSSPKGVSPQGDKSERQEGRDQEPEPGDTPDPARHESCESGAARRPAPRQPDFREKAEVDLEVYADPHHLAAVWSEELDASPAALRGGRAGTGHRGQRGKSMGLMPVWPLELLEAGPAEAEMAVRAVAELCRGTSTRAPRVLEWAAFFGDRAQMPTAWREALAWKLGEAGEPTLGRQYVKPEKDGAPPRALGGPDPMSLFYTGDS